MFENIKGRLLRREVGQLHAHYQDIMRDEFNCTAEVTKRKIYELAREWANENFPVVDLSVLRKYGLVDDIEVINVTMQNPATRLWELRYGFSFPNGCTIAVPADGIRSKYLSVYAGGEREPIGRDQINSLAPFCEAIEIKRTDYRQRLLEFNNFVDKLPLRRDLAARYPEVARRVLPQWLLSPYATRKAAA